MMWQFLKELLKPVYRCILIRRAKPTLKTLTGRPDPVGRLAHVLTETLTARITPDEAKHVTAIERLRAELYASRNQITVPDFGAGSPGLEITPEQLQHGRTVTLTIGPACRLGSKDYPWTLLLFKLVRTFDPRVCLEFGTAFGLSAAYLAAGLQLNGSGMLLTLEGSPAIAEIAQSNFQRLGLNNTQIVVGRFQDTLGPTLAKAEPIDFVFTDGHFDGNALLENFERVYPFLATQSIFVVSSIQWSSGYHQAWQKISTGPQVALAVDLHRFGICFFDKNAASLKSERIYLPMI